MLKTLFSLMAFSLWVVTAAESFIMLYSSIKVVTRNAGRRVAAEPLQGSVVGSRQVGQYIFIISIHWKCTVMAASALYQMCPCSSS